MNPTNIFNNLSKNGKPKLSLVTQNRLKIQPNHSTLEWQVHNCSIEIYYVA